MSPCNALRLPAAIVTTGAFLCTATAFAADEVVAVPPPKQISTSNFIHASSLAWQTVCEWTDAEGKFRNSRSDGLGRPLEKTAPEEALCAAIRRFNFPSGVGFLEAHFQQGHPTPVQFDKSTNLMYVADGHAHHEVDGKVMDSGPGDAFAQAAGKPHQTTALSTDYVQIGMGIPNVGPGEGLKVSDEDIARGNLIHHSAAPKQEVCFIDGKGGAQTVKVRTPENAGTIPAKASCFTEYALLTRPGGLMLEMVTKKDSKTSPHVGPLDTIIYIVKGRVRANIDGEVQEMVAGDAMFHPGGRPHADEFVEDTMELEIRLVKSAKTP